MRFLLTFFDMVQVLRFVGQSRGSASPGVQKPTSTGGPQESHLKNQERQLEGKAAGDLILGGKDFVEKVRKLLKGNRTEQKTTESIGKAAGLLAPDHRGS